MNIFPIANYRGVVPSADHPGGFGFARKNHSHEGVDLYAEPGTEVRAICDGIVVATYLFTGEEVGMPWWNTTYATAVSDDTGIWVYGEMSTPVVSVGERIRSGQTVGQLTPVLRTDKGRPTTMLHIERWKRHTSPHTFLWQVGSAQPEFLCDPTPLLLSLVR